MDLHHTGSNKILEINTSSVNIVIKSKKNWTGVTLDQSSSVAINGSGIRRISIDAVNIVEEVDDVVITSNYCLSVPPLFFEQTDYEIIAKSVDGQDISFWNENYNIREKVTPVMDGDKTLISGVVNFDNMVGFSNFEILVGNKSHLTLRIEVFPTKITYKEDYQHMVADISEMVCEAAIDFMQKTYQMFSLSDKHNTVLAIYFQILSKIFQEYMNAVNKITCVPHHKLITEHKVVAHHKVKKTDRATEKWMMKHQDNVQIINGKIVADRVLGVRKQITYDTAENRYVKFVLKSTISKIEEFQKRYAKSVSQVEDHVISDANNMIRDIRRVLNLSFLKDVSEYSASKSMSLVFGMAPGYRELYKCYIILKKGLTVNGDVFKISEKDTAQLYEYWCFIKLFSLLKKEYRLLSPDIIKVDHLGITVTLVKGNKSEARFINPKTGEIIRLVYNPSESKTQTVNQRPDNVLELEKKGTEVSYKYVFDAKYRIESNPSSNFYPDDKPGPKVDDINTMHRYRDSIVYENKQSKFTFEKTMFGAYILFPLDGKYEESYKNHRFYKSIDTVNIGGLPFLPGSTALVQKLLSDLINDSKESAFERTTLPRGIEEKLAKVDWNKRDVLVGTFRSRAQFEVCYEKDFYYIPKSLITDARLPIHYVALYQTDEKFGKGNGKIQYYGEVLRTALVKRSSIKEVPMTHNNGDELYYKMYVREWLDITDSNESGTIIKPKESGFTCEFTNMFLLEHSEYVQDLRLKNEDEYRFYSELKRNVESAKVEDKEKTLGFVTNDCTFVFSDGEILGVKDEKIIVRQEVAEFNRRPAQVFRNLQYAIVTTS